MYNYNNFVNNYRQNNLDYMNNMFDYSELNNNQNMNLFTPKEGFEKGNLFMDLYSEYKNYKPRKLNPRNDQERLMLEINENLFAAHELNLYLDINPNDNSMLALFNDYRRKAEDLKKQYEQLYGPLCITSDVLNNSPFLWEKTSFPWEGGNN